MKTIRFGRLSVCFAMLALFAQAAGALDIQGATLVSTRQSGSQVVYELQVAGGGNLTVLADGEPTDEQAQRAAYMYRTIMGWEWMNAASLRVTLSGRRAEALVVPTRYTYDGQDLIRYLPSGMQFYLEDILEYDFRMKVGNLFLRIRGQFFDAAELSARLVEVARDPIKYLEKTDPEYLFRTLQETTNAIQQLSAGGTTALQNIRDLVEGYQALQVERVALEQKIAELTQAVETLRTNLQGVEQTAQDLAGAQGTLESQLQAIRAGVLSAGNAGLFSGPRPMDAAMVARVVEIRRADTAATTESILATLKTEGVKATKRQVDLILLVYFGPGL